MAGDKTMQKTILVTGSTDGIGLETARLLVAQGHRVLLHGRNPTKLEQAEKALSVLPGAGRIASYVADLSMLSDVVALAKSVSEQHTQLEVLINNAGVNVHKKALDITEEDFDKIIRVNSKGVYFCSQAAARVMIPKRSGKIINIASVTAFLVRSGVPNSVYAMTKAGIVMLTKALAEEWAQYNIHVNTIAPGYFATPMVADRLTDPEVSKRIISSTPLGRVGEAKDIVGATVFLASEASDYITGQTISIDGGRTIL